MNAEDRDHRALFRAVATLCALGLAVRLLLLAFGRLSVVDGFYLEAAWRLAHGARAYEQCILVAFPPLEALYAALFSICGRPLAAASLLTGAATIATAVLLLVALARGHSRRAGLFAGALYLTAAPILAYHSFEREVWTNVGIAAALCLTAIRPLDARRAAILGLVLALAIAFKLTAALPAALILGWLAWRGEGRRALAAGGVAALALLACALLLAASRGGEFVTQVFLFFFFKGEASPLAIRIELLRAYADPALALGLLGAPLLARDRRLAPYLLLVAAWLAYYLALSPSFWTHNLIDVLLPACAVAGALLCRALERGAWAARFVAVAALAIGVRGAGALPPEWYPHGFGGPDTSAIRDQVALLERESGKDDGVAVPTALLCVLADRQAFYSDYEIEPVVRGVLREVRMRGLEAALARRGTGAILGAPRGVAQPTISGELFQERIRHNAIVHVEPRLLDAIASGELSLLLDPLPPQTAKTLAAMAATGTRVTRVTLGAASGHRLR